MILTKMALALVTILPGQFATETGEIRGVVLNASQNGSISPQTDVVLRANVDGQFLPVAETVSDARGRFVISDLPVGDHQMYLPGANREGVHYPGARVRLTCQQPAVRVTLQVRDTIAEPSPLVIRQHEIAIRSQPGALHVAESILVDNPGHTTYVGRAAEPGTEPVTLRLQIPPDFERVTFAKEFFGRRFSLVDGKLVTSIPWTPGRRWLKFTYTLGNEEQHRVWQRPLDLPGQNVRVSVQHDNPQEVACNLEPASSTSADELVFESAGRTLAAGHEIRVDLGGLSVSWMRYARWVALGLLIGLIGGTVLMMRRRVRGRSTSRTMREPEPAVVRLPRPTARRGRRKRRAS